MTSKSSAAFERQKTWSSIAIAKYGMEGVHNLMALVDDCRIPSFFEGPAYEERFSRPS